MLQQAVPTANALETAINRRMALLHGVAAFLAVNWGRPTLEADFTDFGTRILSGVPGVRTVQYLVDGRIRQTVPMAGNEAAVGRDLLKDSRPEVASDLRKAMSSEGVALSGPIALFQGGDGLIGRLAFRDRSGKLLGVAAMVLDVEPLLREAGLDSTNALWFTLRGAKGEVIAGRGLADSSAGPVRTPVHLPDRAWVLEATPAGGWHALKPDVILPYSVRVGLVIALLALTGFLARSRQLARKQAAEAEVRRAAEEKFSRLFALIPDGVALTRKTDGRIIEINDVLVAMTGMSREELVGKTSLETGLWSTPEGRERMLEALNEEGAIIEFAFALPRRNGEPRECRLSARSVRFDGIDCLLVLVRDVHNQQQLERRLAEAARLESVGRLAGGIAHDFNNLITAMRGYAELLGERLANDSASLNDLREVSRAADRAAALTRQLLAFARKQMVQPRLIDANAAVLGANRLLQQLAGEQVHLVMSIAPTPAPVLIDPSQFEQVLTNLTVNAHDAMPDGGTLRISTNVLDDEVIVTFTDTGSGMSPEALEHLFEPFFTTKESGKGTGLGLATCYGIVQQAGGRIEFPSTDAQGTTVRVTLPRGAGQPVLATTEAVQGEAPHGVEVILLAEDEPQIRRLTERVLSRLGYIVLAAADGAEAIQVATSWEGRIDLLLTDMVMPGITGRELASRIREARPPIRLLLMSGYSEELVAAEGERTPFIGKPFTPTELAMAVRTTLDEPLPEAPAS
ncbi:MAG: ATP-binding protein [Gemmatimonadota bacterium]